MSIFTGNTRKINDLLGLTSRGQQSKNDSLSVTVANDQTAIPVDAQSIQFRGDMVRIVGDDADHLVSSETVVDVAITDDTSLYSSSNSGNYGQVDFFAVGRISGGLRRSIIRADLAGFAGMAISRASLMLYHNDHANTTQDGIVAAYRILPGNSGWVEGTKIGATATLTDPSWLKKSQTPDVNWAGSAGLGTVDTDYISTLAGSVAFRDGVMGWHNLPLNTSEFLNLIAANNGLLLKELNEDEDGKVAYFSSSEAANVAKRPFFRISYGETEQATRALLIPNGPGCTWSTNGVATVDSAPIPTGGIDVPIMRDGFPMLAVYVPAGVNLWVAKLGA
jgi:hypothetical protein